MWNSLTMGITVLPLSASFKKVSFFSIVCVFFSPEEKQPVMKNMKFVTHQRYCKWGWSTNPKTGAASEQPTRASCKTVLA